MRDACGVWHDIRRHSAAASHRQIGGYFTASPCVALSESPAPQLQDKLQDRAPGAFGGYRGGRREAGLLAAACEAYAGGPRVLVVWVGEHCVMASLGGLMVCGSAVHYIHEAKHGLLHHTSPDAAPPPPCRPTPAAEARRLLPAAEAERLAAQFEALQAALQPLVGGFRPVAY